MFDLLLFRDLVGAVGNFSQTNGQFVYCNNLFTRYQVIPYGNYSYVKVLSDDKVLPLYGSGGFRMIFDTKVGELQGDNSGW